MNHSSPEARSDHPAIMDPRETTVPYTEEELKHLDTLFRELPTYKLDDDGGTVHSSDIPEMWEFMGLKRTLAQAQVAVMCWNKYCFGVVTLAQFQEGVAKVHDPSAYAGFLAQVVDKDRDGYISADEFTDFRDLMAVLHSKLKGLTFDEFVRQADTNKDGRVSIEECTNWINSIN